MSGRGDPGEAECLGSHRAMGWVFLSALQAEMETALHDAVTLCELQGREEALEARIYTLKEDLLMVG